MPSLSAARSWYACNLQGLFQLDNYAPGLSECFCTCVTYQRIYLYLIILLQNERLQGGNEIPTSIQQLLHYMRIDDFAGTISDEIGGGNGIQPMIVAAEMGKPVLDADLMGRAYPNV